MKKIVTIMLLISVMCTMGLTTEPTFATHTHTYKVVKTKAATCKKTGYKNYECECGATKSVTIKKGSHNYSCYKTKASTCKKTGKKYYKCKVCGKKTTKKIAKKAHSYKLYKTKKATFSKNGYKYYKCKKCKTKKKVTIIKLSEGAKIKLNQPDKLVFKAPTQADFGENYDKAVQFYERLMAHNGQKLVLEFSSIDELRTFNSLLSSKVMGGKYPIIGSSVYNSKHATHTYSGLDMFYESELEEVSDSKYVYSCCKKAGLYNGMTERTAVKKINSWICKNISYKLVSNTSYVQAFKNKKGKCMHYAEMFDAMCEMANIDCKYVSGRANGGAHAWNKVKVGSYWYWVDTCWNDTGGNKTKYLLSRSLWSSHKIK